MGRPQDSRNRQTLDRMNAVEGMLLEHYSDAQVVHVARKEWGVAEKTARRYLRLVRERWLEEEEEKRAFRKAAAVARLHAIGRKARGMPAVLVQVEKQIAEIEGTKAPEKIEQTTVNLDAEADQALAMIAAALGLDPEDLADA